MPKALPHLLVGLTCLGILTALLIEHAWPLWFGREVIVRLRYPTEPYGNVTRDQAFFSAPFLRLRVWLDDRADQAERAAVVPWRPLATTVRFADDQLPQLLVAHADIGRRFFLQFYPPEPCDAVTISDAPVPGAINLAIRLRHIRPEWTSDKKAIASVLLTVQDDLYLPGITRQQTHDLQAALRADHDILAVLDVIPEGRLFAGHARLKDPLIDGRPVLGRAIVSSPPAATQPSF